MWIAFVLWKIDICYNIPIWHYFCSSVVNCFCSLKDWYLLQRSPSIKVSESCCELLLFFERLIFATTNSSHFLCAFALWIAFVLWKIDICYNIPCMRIHSNGVVNCFCSLKDWYLLQRNIVFVFNHLSCELLLFFERLIFATTIDISRE